MRPRSFSHTTLAERHPWLGQYLANPWESGTPPQVDGRLLHDYVARGGDLVTAAARRDLRASLALLREKGRALRADDREREADCVAFLTRFLSGSGSAGPRSAALCRAVNEAAFALLYLIGESDLVPDDLPGIGLADAAAVLTAVLERNERVLRDFARQLDVEWERLAPIDAGARVTRRCIFSPE
jgi:uncharacterized membrane protein YkvA (DUF1232 family)